MLNATPNDRSGDGAGVILVAIDGSATSLHAEAWATHLAHARGSQLLYLFVQTHFAYAELGLLTGAEIPSDLGAGELAKHILEEVRADAEACHVHGEFLVRSGDPATEIERVADDRIRAYVILCWLALLLIRIAETTTGHTWNHLREDLQELHVGTFERPAGTFRQRTELTTEQRNILGKLNIEPPKKIIKLGLPTTP